MSKKNGKPTLFEEFKTFINKGNAMALAVGTIIGGAFSGITKSVTNDLIMPLVNIFMGGADFSDAKIALPRMPWVTPTYETVVNESGEEVVQEVLNYLTYGNFISAVINFFIMAIVVFIIVKAMNTLTEAATRKEREAAEAAAAAAAAAAAEEAAKNPPAPTSEELLAEIRDLLKNK
ncbi:MAG: large conductance mechanosensitive channel protein MscL [Oscillospiraceae bacterium]|nr:large conductance mechanosensitive channel protein MscL [Oscillospiraceae bacterium]